MATKEYTIALSIHVRTGDEKDLPAQKDVENLACGLLLTPPAVDTDTKWNVYATHVRKDE